MNEYLCLCALWVVWCHFGVYATREPLSHGRSVLSAHATDSAVAAAVFRHKISTWLLHRHMHTLNITTASEKSETFHCWCSRTRANCYITSKHTRAPHDYFRQCQHQQQQCAWCEWEELSHASSGYEYCKNPYMWHKKAILASHVCTQFPHMRTRRRRGQATKRCIYVLFWAKRQ